MVLPLLGPADVSSVARINFIYTLVQADLLAYADLRASHYGLLQQEVRFQAGKIIFSKGDVAMRIVIEIKSGVFCSVTTDAEEPEVILIDHDVDESQKWHGVVVNPQYVKKIFNKIEKGVIYGG